MKTARQKPLKEDGEMNQNEKRVYLIKRLLKEQPRYRNMQIPIDTDQQKTMLRSLMNVQYLTQRRLMNIQSVRKSTGERLLNIRNMKKSPRI